MAEFTLDRFKYRWRGNWTTGADYRKDDIIRINGKSYVCLVTHTASALFRDDLNAILPGSDPPQPQPKWVVMTSGRFFAGTWATATAYNKGDLVIYEGSVYECVTSHTSGVFATDALYVEQTPYPTNLNWKLYVLGNKYSSTWATSLSYGLGQLVKYGGLVYKCMKPHVSSVFEDDILNWERFYEGQNYLGPWTHNTDYKINDLVKYGGSIFKCIESHTSSHSEIDDAKFTLELLGSQHDGEWDDTVAYNQGDIVRYGGTLYYAINNNKDSNPSQSQAADSDDSTIDWIVLVKSYNFRGQWDKKDSKTEFVKVTVGTDTVTAKESGNFYINGVEKGVITLLTGKVYIFNQNDPSNATFNVSQPFFLSKTINGTIGGGVVLATDATKGITIKYNLDGVEVTASAYEAGFSSANTRFVSVQLDNAVPSTVYYYGTATEMGAGLQVAPNPEPQPYNREYRTGDIVQRGGDLYYAIQDVSISDGDNSSTDWQDSERWERLASGTVFSSGWAENQFYSYNEVVNFMGTAYVCTVEHESTVNNYPGDNGSGTDYWDVIVQEGVRGALWQKGDLLTYGTSRDLAGDESTLGDKRLLIGESNEVLSVSNDLEMFWRKQINDSDTIYVANHGVDDAANGYGLSEKSPFKTIRYACEYVEDNFTQEVSSFTPSAATYDPFTGLLVLTIGNHNLQIDSKITLDPGSLTFTCASDGNVAQVTYPRSTDPAGNYNDLVILARSGTSITVNVGTSSETSVHTFISSTDNSVNYQAPIIPIKIFVATGSFTEVGPITIPAGCVVMGDELRATKVNAATPLPNYTSMYTYVQDWTLRLKQVIAQIVLLQTATIDENNTFAQDKTGPASNEVTVAKINALIDDFENYLGFVLASGDAVTLTGSNNPNSNEADTDASAIIKRNIDIIAEEMVLYTRGLYSITLPETEIRNDVKHLLRAMQRDLNYSGNYMTLMSARKLANSVQGCQLDDLFWVRDTTGLRNVTTDGLKGTLNPPGVFEEYQRPTGGSCVALDPGWGPDDRRTWISRRSPYIQGVTNIGVACIGKKIDGSLHNGGNRSMVSNDFTQVLSDGIGAYVVNNARTELVSVFTYYCQVGYLAENGGIIRATNGNNSYGKYGSIAQGVDANEVPQSCTVNNRENEAIVNQAVAGGANDEFIVFEYDHCGEQYTSASAEITGAGADVDVAFTEFREGALSNVRLTNTTGSGSEGGSNYLIKQNSAQVTTNNTSIILNVNDNTQFESEILGMRIIIVGGTGVGQYAEIKGFTLGTKTVDVKKESDGTDGWDHMLSGTAIEPSLDATTIYRIEPRVYANKPAFVQNFTPMPTVRDWADIAKGGTTATYANITGGAGTGQTPDGPAVNAIWTVVRAGKTYSVTNVNSGAGYAVNDTITIAGTSLGGASPANDIVIKVTSNSDDSTNSIQTFTFTGTPRGERFVAIDNTNVAAYSDDGNNWLEVNLPYASTYKRLLAADNKFIALSTPDNRIAYSLDGQNWTQRSLPVNATWTDIAYGNGKFVIVASNTDSFLYSSDGLTWNSGSMPTGDDSAADEWLAVEYGQGRFLAITGSQTRDAAYSTNGETWVRLNAVMPNYGGYQPNWIDLRYGANRFMAMAGDGKTIFSFDKGATWTLGTDAPSIDGSTAMNWKRMKYNQGVFFAICDTGGVTMGDDPTTGPTNYSASTEDGVLWTERTISYEGTYTAMGACVIDNKPTFLVLRDQETNNAFGKLEIGCQAKIRANVITGSFNSIKIWECGSGYTTVNPIDISIIDNQYVTEVEYQLNVKNGVLAQPDFLNRGAGYRSSTSGIVISGDGFAEIVPEDSTLVLNGVDKDLPGPGVQIKITGILDDTTEDPDDLKLFTGVGAVDLGDDGSGNGTRTVRFTISPSLKNENNLAHTTSAELRTRYSQCRVSGHDFLDIGTGNFEQTNYPELYSGGAYFTASPENEVTETGGGRVFYVSTDQDGNFRVGELFGVNQATGVVTISAQFFDLDGLSELALGGVRLGGTGTVVNEFSTDPTFSADSNNIIPTQKAIATFLADRLSVGGSDLETNSITAGSIQVGTSDNIINNVAGTYLNIPRRVNFYGADPLGNPAQMGGSLMAQMMFMRRLNHDGN